MIDVLTYMVPNPATLDSKSFHLGSKQAGVNPMFVLQSPLTTTSGWIYYIKNPSGFPWDINFYDQNYVYQCITEGPSGWTNPSSYKVFASTSWPGGHGGIGWSPRYIGDGPFENYLVTEDTTYQTWLNGALQATQNLGAVSTLVQGPFNLACGDLGTLACIILSYQWNNPGVPLGTQEQFWYAYGYGQVRWQEYQLSSGIYVLKTDALFDQKVAGGTPTPVFQGTLP